MHHQFVSGVVISITRPGSLFWPLCVSSVCKWCSYFNHMAWLTILASVCHQTVSSVQPQGPAYHSGLFMYHQEVSGVVMSTTRPGSPFWPLCVLSGSKWYGYVNTRPGSPFWPLYVPSDSKWCGSFRHKAWLTILASLCAISM